MRSTRLLAGLAFVALLGMAAAPAHAQTPIKFGVSGGVALPLGDFGDAAKLGFLGQGHVTLKLANAPISLRGDGFFQRHSIDGADGNFQIIGGTANVVYEFGAASPTKVYVIGGLGYYSVKVDITIPGIGSGSATESDIGVNGGAGIKFAGRLFVEGRFHNVFSEGSSTTFVPVVVGVSFSAPDQPGR